MYDRSLKTNVGGSFISIALLWLRKDRIEVGLLLIDFYYKLDVQSFGLPQNRSNEFTFTVEMHFNCTLQETENNIVSLKPINK
ncbi:hypothetical protein BLOT_004923 [Blomia tropicalis]|nr:hypothetical protein BLOT_004923 [Blomia tropicalis]